MDDLNQLAPLQYLKIFFRRKWLFIIPTITGLVLGICTGIILPKKYESSTMIMVEEGKSDNPLFDNLAVSSTITQRMNTIREAMLSWNSLVELIKRMQLDKDVKTAYEFELLVDRIRNDIGIRPKTQSIINISYVSGDPKEAQAVVQNITDIFIERNVQIQNQETADAIKFIEEQLRVYKGKIMSAEIAELQDQLNALLVDSTESHPKVKELREQIGAKKAELEKENLTFTESSSIKVETANPLINEIKKTLDTLQVTDVTAAPRVQPSAPGSEIYKVMLMDKLDTVMARDVQVNEGIYNMLLQRLETAKITQRLQSSKEGTKYTVLDPPRIPLKPFQPNKFLLAFIGLFLGVVAGGAFVVMTEFLDNSFLDVQEAKEYFGEPLLGAISKITTPDSIREEQEKQKWYLGITLITGMIAIIVSVFISNLLK